MKSRPLITAGAALLLVVIVLVAASFWSAPLEGRERFEMTPFAKGGNLLSTHLGSRRAIGAEHGDAAPNELAWQTEKIVKQRWRIS